MRESLYSPTVDYGEHLVLHILAGQRKVDVHARAMLRVPRRIVGVARAILYLVQVDESAGVVPSEYIEVPTVNIVSDQGRKLHEIKPLDIDIFICKQSW